MTSKERGVRGSCALLAQCLKRLILSKGAKKHNAPHGKPHRALLSGEPVEALQGAAQCNTAKLCCMAAAKQLLGGYDVDQTALNVDHLLDALAC